jgi:hypothetical protein
MEACRSAAEAWDVPIRLVALSGYPDGGSGVETLDGYRVGFLPKPFAPKALANVFK